MARTRQTYHKFDIEDLYKLLDDYGDKTKDHILSGVGINNPLDKGVSSFMDGILGRILLEVNKAINESKGEVTKLVKEKWINAIKKNIYDAYQHPVTKRSNALIKKSAFLVDSNFGKDYSFRDRIYNQLGSVGNLDFNYYVSITHTVAPDKYYTQTTSYKKKNGKTVTKKYKRETKAYKQGLKYLLPLLEEPFTLSTKAGKEKCEDSIYDLWYLDRKRSRYNKRRKSTIKSTITKGLMNDVANVYKKNLRAHGFKINGRL